MIEAVLVEFAKAGGIELFMSACRKLLQKVKTSKDIKQLFVNTDNLFIDNENDTSQLFDDMPNILSKENIEKLSNELKDESGYNIKDKLLNSLMDIMKKYEIPHGIAMAYANAILIAILDQLPEVAPEKYDRVFQAEWKKEQEESFRELADDIEKIRTELQKYQNQQLEILSADTIDLDIRRYTNNPKIALDFFTVDDEAFKEALQSKKNDEVVAIRARCKEEAIYCTINELWRQGEKRPIFIVKNEVGWKKLLQIKDVKNIYIPWFYSDQIVAIPDNTNIFFFTEQIPSFIRGEITLRPRTYSTIVTSLQKVGMNINEANNLVLETHGLFIPLKKKLFHGAYLKEPRWLNELQQNIKETALLVGQWIDCDGDKAIIESLSGIKYQNFISEIRKYARDEDPFVNIVDINSTKEYYLASAENTWDYIDIDNDSEIWKKFKDILVDVINESEKLFTYTPQERFTAQLKGEKLFWSDVIRKGMLRSLIMKAYYKNDGNCKGQLDSLVCKIMEYIQTPEQWHYISNFFTDLCEVSPNSVLKKLEEEQSKPTGLLKLFEHQSSDFLFGKNDYTEILWGVEEFLVQKEYASRAYEWLLYLDNLSLNYESNSTMDIFEKLLCTWYNYSAFNTCKEKIAIAEKALEKDRNAWKYILASMPTSNRCILGLLYAPTYRNHVEEGTITKKEMYETNLGYINLLLKATNNNPSRWNDLLSIYDKVEPKTRKKIKEKILFEITQMDDDEKLIIKDHIRKLVYKHRYFASAEWSMGEDLIDEMLDILNSTNFTQQEYDFEYLFSSSSDGIILDPVPYDSDAQKDLNDNKINVLIARKISEFKQKGYNLELLSKLCAKSEHSCLGRELAEHWSDNNFDENVFVSLYKCQSNHEMAVDYIRSLAHKGVDIYTKVIGLSESLELDDHFRIILFRIETLYTDKKPLVDNASVEIKRAFWKDFNWNSPNNMDWAVTECQQYGTLNSYLDLLYQLQKAGRVTPAQLLEKMQSIDVMERRNINALTNYYLKELLCPFQKQYISDRIKCSKIAHIEISFFTILEWEDMKCFQKELRQDPEMYAEMISIICRHEDDVPEVRKTKEFNNYAMVIQKLFDMAKFCPCEENGNVNYGRIKAWVDKLIRILDSNHQIKLFGYALGRLFAYAPRGTSGYYPCDAVCRIIEEYGDDSLLREYRIELFNKRGIFSPSSGKAEKDIAKGYKENAELLNIKYPKTAEVFFKMSQIYEHDSDEERRRAENGYY